MEITIKDTNAYQHSIENDLLLWRLHFKKSIRLILLQYAIGIFLLVFGFLTFGEPNKTTYTNNSTGYHSVSHTNYHLTESMGIVYILLVSMNLILLFRKKSIFLENGRETSKLYFTLNNESLTRLTDESFAYESQILKMEVKWEFFCNYSIFGNYLFLHANDSLFTAVLIDKRMISENQFQELMVFVGQRLKEKKK
jgi:hypothetical protein